MKVFRGRNQYLRRDIELPMFFTAYISSCYAVIYRHIYINIYKICRAQK
jgi:hypothetical protein